MSTRPVHYRAAGTGGLAFKCYYDESRANLDSKVERPLKPGQNFGPRGSSFLSRPGFYHEWTIPPPKGHTDLRRVTCPACWREIARMAREANR